MKISRISILIVCLILGLAINPIKVNAQSTGISSRPYDSILNGVIVHKDPRVDLLVKKQVAINTAAKKSSGRTMRGYRLLIANTSSRDEAIDAKTKVYTYFPDVKVYLTYQSPFFKVKAGNFQTRDEAKRYQDMMKSLFPKGVFILGDTIEVKPEKEEIE